MSPSIRMHADAPFSSILTITLKLTAQSRPYWAGRPAMRVVQAWHRPKNTLPADKPRIIKRLTQVLADPQGDAIRQDMIAGFNTLPAWMQAIIRELPGSDLLVGASSTTPPA